MPHVYELVLGFVQILVKLLLNPDQYLTITLKVSVKHQLILVFCVKDLSTFFFILESFFIYIVKIFQILLHTYNESSVPITVQFCMIQCLNFKIKAILACLEKNKYKMCQTEQLNILSVFHPSAWKNIFLADKWDLQDLCTHFSCGCFSNKDWVSGCSNLDCQKLVFYRKIQ